MGSIFVVKPENNEFLTSLSPSPVFRSVQVKQVEVDPTNRCWTVLLAGNTLGEPILWEEIANKLIASIDEIDSVNFVWEDQSSGGTQDTYMENLMKTFTGPQTTQTTPIQSKLGTGNDFRKSGRRNRRLDKEITQRPIPIRDILEEEHDITISGIICKLDQRTTRTGKILVMFDLYDQTDSITCKFFINEEKDMPTFKMGDWLKVKGSVQYQSFDGELSLMVASLNPVEAPLPVVDKAKDKRIEFHLHTKMSGMDGTINVIDGIEQAAKWGHTAIALTDHGVVQAFPEAYWAGKQHGIKIIYGLEGYLVDGEKDRPYHVIILAKNKVGLKNLYKLVSISHLKHFYRRPRIPRKLLSEYRDGLIIGSACEAGELYQAVMRQADNILEIAAFYDYLEIQPLGNNDFLIGTEYVRSVDDLKRINQQILSVGQTLNRPVVATGDVHFLRPEDGLYRKILLIGQGFEDAEHQAPLYFRTTAEMLKEFEYLESTQAEEVVITNPNKIAGEIDDLIPVPEGLHPPIIPEAADRLREMSYNTARSVYGNELPQIVADRLEKELNSIIGNGYASLYYTAHKLVKKSMDDGYLVGSRGSVGSSFVATMCGITEVNPLPPHYVCSGCRWSKFIADGSVGTGVDLPDVDCPDCGQKAIKLGYDIPFEVFMGFHGDKVPDIDLNFSGEYQATINRYTEELFGSDYVYRAGTIGTLADKTAYGFVKKYLEQMRETRRNAEVNRMLKRITGVRRTTGQHPGGMIVVPSDMDIYDFTPVQYPANDSTSGIVTTHFEFKAIHDSLVKLDNLGHDNPTIIRMLEDITGMSGKEIPLDDPATMSLFTSTTALGVTPEQIGSTVGTLGIPEFGTHFTRQMLVETQPKTFAELVSISGLSHGTNVWTNNAQELIKDKVTDFTNVIACRDDIMVYLIYRGLQTGDAFRIMEQVRKGKGLQSEDVTLMKNQGVPDWYIDSCNKIKYMFPKAHAVAYVMMAFRIAYAKVHFPVAFYATYFSMKVEDFNAALIIHGEESVRQGMTAILSKGNEATAKEKAVITILEVVLEAMCRKIQFLPVDLYASDHRRFRIVDGKLLPPLAALEGIGVNASLSIVEARTGGEFTSIADLRTRGNLSKKVIEVLRENHCLAGMSETNQLSLF